jgi:hypothetical protein
MTASHFRARWYFLSGAYRRSNEDNRIFAKMAVSNLCLTSHCHTFFLIVPTNVPFFPKEFFSSGCDDSGIRFV